MIFLGMRCRMGANGIGRGAWGGVLVGEGVRDQGEDVSILFYSATLQVMPFNNPNFVSIYITVVN